MGIHLRTDPPSVPQAHAVDSSGWITCWARWAPGKTAARSADRPVTCAEPGRDIGSVAAWLRPGGVWPGDRLAYRGPDCAELLELLGACSRPGAVFVPLEAWPPSGCREEAR